MHVASCCLFFTVYLYIQCNIDTVIYLLICNVIIHVIVYTCVYYPVSPQQVVWGNEGTNLAEAKPTVAVDGSHNDRAMSVDGMNFEPHHRCGCGGVVETGRRKDVCRDILKICFKHLCVVKLVGISGLSLFCF